VAGGAAQLATVVGALAEPGADRLGSGAIRRRMARGGAGYYRGLLSFLGFHAVLPHWKNASVMATFAVTMLLVAGLAFFSLKPAAVDAVCGNRCALELAREGDDAIFGKRAADDLQSDGQAVDVAAGNRDGR